MIGLLGTGTQRVDWAHRKCSCCYRQPVSA